ncbi:hypothetical protein KUTeg_012769 [Tegillarca granosa]|uniref:Uncharacterized protein n=1 Tax=Tegillarca granosa TaxID=220873 RepID=A0ABQ9F0P7_TEGGR|nr:hypothetical protein KUTeg_012769 [Tegillarca granosa]
MSKKSIEFFTCSLSKGDRTFEQIPSSSVHLKTHFRLPFILLFFLQTDWNDGQVLSELVANLGGPLDNSSLSSEDGSNIQRIQNDADFLLGEGSDGMHRRAVFQTDIIPMDNYFKVKTAYDLSSDWQIDYITGSPFEVQISEMSDIKVYSMQDVSRSLIAEPRLRLNT